MMLVRDFVALLVLAPLAASGAVLGGCSAGTTPAPTAPVAAAPPPKDDGSASQGGVGGGAHAAALEQLKIAPLA